MLEPTLPTERYISFERKSDASLCNENSAVTTAWKHSTKWKEKFCDRTHEIFALKLSQVKESNQILIKKIHKDSCSSLDMINGTNYEFQRYIIATLNFFGEMLP